MTPDTAVQVLREALMATLWLSAPILIIGFAAGALISLFQIVTSIQDPAVSTVPRLAVFLGAGVLLAPWMVQRIVAYTAGILSNLARYAH